jgi:murein DD-endopeptidase MepM/ murein hydrolase activator NlpD
VPDQSAHTHTRMPYATHAKGIAFDITLHCLYAGTVSFAVNVSRASAPRGVRPRRSRGRLRLGQRPLLAISYFGLVMATTFGLGAWTPAAAAASAPASAAGSTTTATPMPSAIISSPRDGGSYQRGSRIVARFGCSQGGDPSPIATCQGSVPTGHAIDTRSTGTMSFTVTSTDASGNTFARTVHYTVWAYVNPLRAITGLQAQRIDMGVDYAGSGPLLAIGRARVIFASNNVGGPESCWGRTCAPPGSGMVVYRLLNGPFAGKYVYIVEAITVKVKPGQTVRVGQTIAILHHVSPNLEIGWAAGHGPETLAVKFGHQCSCVDPGGWTSVEGRNFNSFLVWLGAPSGYLQSTPKQHMPRGWPRLPARDTAR